MHIHPKLEKFDPAVDKRLLVGASGLVWCVVGVILFNVAVSWLIQAPGQKALFFGPAGFILSLLIHHFGFLRLVDTNISRILSKKDKVCFFAFQPWKSYLIIAVMVATGITLRHSPIPKPYLAVIYIGFGGAMVLSSIRYFRVFFKLMFSSE